MAEDVILLSPPDVGERERTMLLAAFDSGWIAPVGADLTQFEEEMARALGARRCVALSSGTAALHLSLLALGVRAGDPVLVPSFTFAATVNAVRYVGARPVLVDVDPATWTLDPRLTADCAARLARRGRAPAAIVAVDVYGQCADYGPLGEVAERYGIPVVEDSAESLGSTYRGAAAGTLGATAVLSFNGNKIITTGGGGMLVTDDDRIADTARYLATQARAPVRHYEHADVGYNYRLSNLLAALGRAQLAGLGEKVARRRAVNRLYREELGALAGLSFMPDAAYGTSNCWLTCLTVDEPTFGAGRDEVLDALEAERIEARPLWKPMHLQPAYRGLTLHGPGVCERLFESGLCLPSGSGLRDEDVRRVAGAIRAVGERSRRTVRRAVR